MAEKLSTSTWKKWDEKLNNWALLYGGTGASVSPAYELLDRQEVREGDGTGRAAVWETPEPPPLIGEAMDTNALVTLLIAEQHDAVHAWYCLSGTVDMRADAIHVHVNTLRNRTRAAVVELERMDGARQRGDPLIRRTAVAASGSVVRRSQSAPAETAD